MTNHRPLMLLSLGLALGTSCVSGGLAFDVADKTVDGAARDAPEAVQAVKSRMEKRTQRPSKPADPESRCRPAAQRFTERYAEIGRMDIPRAYDLSLFIGPGFGVAQGYGRVGEALAAGRALCDQPFAVVLAYVKDFPKPKIATPRYVLTTVAVEKPNEIYSSHADRRTHQLITMAFWEGMFRERGYSLSNRNVKKLVLGDRMLAPVGCPEKPFYWNHKAVPADYIRAPAPEDADDGCWGPLPPS